MDLKELNDFLVDSRKSFRNLYIYIDRVKDIMKEIDSALVGQQYTSGHTQFSTIAKDNKQANLENWAWDWLPMYNYDFYFSENVETKIKFSVTVIADTGFYDNKQLKKIDKLNLDSFISADDSLSKIIFSIGKNLWFDDLKKGEKQKFNLLYSKSQDEFKNYTDKSKYIYAHAYNLNSFLTKEDIRTNLQIFINRCKELNLDTIKLKEE